MEARPLLIHGVSTTRTNCRGRHWAPPTSISLIVLMSITLLPGSSWAHGGGLDGFDCHHDRKHGGYHCHRGPLAGEMFASQEEMLAALKALQARQNKSPTVPVASHKPPDKTVH